MSATAVILGAAHVKDGVPLVQAVVPVGDATNDVEPFGECELIQCLGVTALPWGASKDGYAEGIAILGVGGRDAVIVGARDVRTAKIVGKMKPGDTVVHSTGPKMSAQLQLKEEKQQAILTTNNSRGETMMVILDGKADEAQIIGGGCVFKMSAKDGIVLADSTGGGIHIKDGVVRITGKELMLPGAAPNPAFKLMAGPMTGSPGGAASTPMIAVKGVTIGV